MGRVKADISLEQVTCIQKRKRLKKERGGGRRRGGGGGGGREELIQRAREWLENRGGNLEYKNIKNKIKTNKQANKQKPPENLSAYQINKA